MSRRAGRSEVLADFHHVERPPVGGFEWDEDADALRPAVRRVGPPAVMPPSDSPHGASCCVNCPGADHAKCCQHLRWLAVEFPPPRPLEGRTGRRWLDFFRLRRARKIPEHV